MKVRRISVKKVEDYLEKQKIPVSIGMIRKDLGMYEETIINCLHELVSQGKADLRPVKFEYWLLK